MNRQNLSNQAEPPFRDHFAVAHTEKEMIDRLLDLRDERVEDSELRSKYNLKDTRDWRLASARKRIRSDNNWKEGLVECCYRPFDNRYSYLSYVAMDYPRRELLQHVYGKDNICILASRQQSTSGFRHSWITNLPAESCVVSTKTKEQNYVFPLYLYHSKDQQELVERRPHKEANIHHELIAQLEKIWELEFLNNRDGKASFTPEDIVYFVYAVMNSGSYRERYCDLLKTDFPRIPFPKDREVFFAVSGLGKTLSELHMLNVTEEADVEFPVKGSNRIEQISYMEAEEKLYINKEQYLTKIAPEIWEYQIGGYDFVSKWIKDRPKKEFSYSDLTAFRKIVASCLQTVETAKTIDQVIAQAGGWTMAVIPHEESTTCRATQEKVLEKTKALPAKGKSRALKQKAYRAQRI